jgi:hypothetical protein
MVSRRTFVEAAVRGGDEKGQMLMLVSAVRVCVRAPRGVFCCVMNLNFNITLRLIEIQPGIDLVVSRIEFGFQIRDYTICLFLAQILHRYDELSKKIRHFPRFSDLNQKLAQVLSCKHREGRTEIFEVEHFF